MTKQRKKFTGSYTEDAPFVVSSKQHCVYEYPVDELLKGPVAGTKYGSVSGHRDGVDICWSNPSGICSFRNTVFVSDTGNKAVRLLILCRDGK